MLSMDLTENRSHCYRQLDRMMRYSLPRHYCRQTVLQHRFCHCHCRPRRRRLLHSVVPRHREMLVSYLPVFCSFLLTLLFLFVPTHQNIDNRLISLMKSIVYVLLESSIVLEQIHRRVVADHRVNEYVLSRCVQERWIRSEPLRLQSRTRQSKDCTGHIQERGYQSCLRIQKQFSYCLPKIPPRRQFYIS